MMRNINELYHYGVLGMHWGVRRYQPYGQGGYIPKEKEKLYRLQKAAKTKKYVDNIINTMSIEDKLKLGMNVNDLEYLTIEQGEYILHRELKKINNVPVSFFDILDDGDIINLALGTRSEDKYRNHGYGNEAASQAIKWLEDHPKIQNGRDIVWGVRVDNSASIAIAKKNGFVIDPTSYSDDKQWVNYVKKAKVS